MLHNCYTFMVIVIIGYRAELPSKNSTNADRQNQLLVYIHAFLYTVRSQN